jgi:predicted nucleotidyltransferase
MDSVLRAVTDLIVRCCDPEEVVLFGSWAKGTAQVGSDLDLLVIGDFRASRWLRDRALREELRTFPIAVDLHLLTREEFRIESAKEHTYLNTLRWNGRSLYRRPESAEEGARPSCADG